MSLNQKFVFSLSVAAVFMFATFTSCTSTTNPPVNPIDTSVKGLVVTANTSTAGGNYSPKNVLAVWVVNSSGVFVKSLAVYASQRKYDLTSWQSVSKGSTTDAATGATRSSYSPISVKWNGTDASGNLVPDGTYKICMELTDKSTSGNYSSFSFTKGLTATTLTPSNVPSFSNITINWQPL